MTNSISFNVNVIDSCNSVIISTVSLSTPSNYDIKSGTAQSLGNIAWTRDLT
jgi:hypothetical protein